MKPLTKSEHEHGESSTPDRYSVAKEKDMKRSILITITCIDAGGTARVGTLTKVWNYPGKPGRN